MNPEFYEDEVIEGFYVPSMLKKAWGAQLDVLNETDKICARHNIPYFADWGTLLAAIRHNGYIPWDDDLDISMRRKDYERFLKYAATELPEGFKVMNYKNHPGHHFFVARIVGKPRICFEEEHLTRFHGFPYIAGIDLFILDNVARDRKLEDLKSKKAEFVVTVADNIADGKVSGADREKLLCECEAYTDEKIDRSLAGEDLRVRMYELTEKLFASIPDEESDALVQMMPFGMYGRQSYIPKEYYRRTVRLPYMETSISVPLCYDAVMRSKFGQYMRIQKTWETHDYPFYSGQHRDLVAVLDFDYPEYKASRSDLIRPERRPSAKSGDGIRDMVFVPFAAKYWKYMEKMYAYYADKDDWRVWVVPIPYYYKSWDGSLSEEIFDKASYPPDLYLQDYKEVDLESFHPEAVVIQNPFDEWNSTYSVPPEFYSTNLLSFTEELIYIPFFVTDDFSKESGREYTNMDSYVCMPGVINAHRVILPSETLKDTYRDKIMDFVSCCDDEVSDVLDKKLAVCPEFIYRKDRSGSVGKTLERSTDKAAKKKIVYFLTISFLAENKLAAIKKINKTFDVFYQNRDRLDVIWITQCIRDNIDLLDKEVADGFGKAVERYEQMHIGEYFEDMPKEGYMNCAGDCDAYYGDPSALALAFYYEHKPVMIESLLS
ncbi:MAG: LicD family protein [Lachnospiraceae bacterium]|nr:LicD family protein [Lachnospiraceae bacterium]